MGDDPEATYAARTPRSKALFAEALDLLPGGVDSNLRGMHPYPFFLESAKGVRLRDVDGNEYLDFLLGQGSTVHGHGHPAIRAAVEGQMERGELTALASPLSVDLAREIRRRVPSMAKVRFTASGTEATMNAVRLARAFTGRRAVAKPEGTYHGGHDGLLWSIYRYGDMPGTPRNPEPFPHSLGVPAVLRDLVAVFQFNDLEATEEVLRRRGADLAAVILEPIMGNVGVIPPADGYLQGIAKICKELDIPLIFDEVMTGFRVAPGGAQELYGIQPDLTTFGKILGGGLPQGAVGGRREIMDLLGPGDPERHAFHGGTNAGHPLAMAAGLAALRLLDEGAYARLDTLGRQLFGGLQEAADDAGVHARVKYVGSVGHVHFSREEIIMGRDGLEKGDWRRLARWCLEGVNRGVLLGHPMGEKIFVATTHTPRDIDEALEAAAGAFRALP